MTRKDRIQYLVISHLREKGEIELSLPDGIKLGIGVTQEDVEGNVIIDDDYCWVSATKLDKGILLDSFNLGLSYAADPATIIFEDENINDEGVTIKSLDVV
jgi:hypothetical protein